MAETGTRKNGVLLRDENFNTAYGMVTVCWDAGTWASINQYSEDDKVFDSQRLPQIPDIPTARGGTNPRVTFRNPFVRKGSVSSIPHSSLQPVSFNLYLRFQAWRHQVKMWKAKLMYLWMQDHDPSCLSIIWD